jgi:hypothetical protein
MVKKFVEVYNSLNPVGLGACPSQPYAPPVIRLGLSELGLSAGELRKQDRNIKLQGQPFRVLVSRRRPGEVVTREELQQGLWARR